MIDFVIKKIENPMETGICVDLGTDKPLWEYVKQAIQDIETLNMFRLNPLGDYDDNDDFGKKHSDYKDNRYRNAPFIHVINWEWNPTPNIEEIQYRRRETGDKLLTKTIADARIGILKFDMYCGARDKNGNMETKIIHNMIYVPIEDDKGRYLLENLMYSEYQLVDKLLYPMGKNTLTFKSLLPIVVKYKEATITSIDDYVVTGRVAEVKIFSTMEPAMKCFMHIPGVLRYLGVYPILKFVDTVEDDKNEYEYFKPLDNTNIYIKAYKKGLEKFPYVKSILLMMYHIIKSFDPPSIVELLDPQWWVYILSYKNTTIEHRGACNQTHVARMLDTISAEQLPIPECDKTNMTAFLRYILQTNFENIDIFSFSNKRLRLNEIISTIVTQKVSDKLKSMFRYGNLLKMKDMEQILKFSPQIILKEFHNLGTHHVIDFANDLDYFQLLRFTKNGPNSLGRNDKHRITISQRQLHPDMIGVIDLLESSKDVGQSGMISPWCDMSNIKQNDINKYPNVKYDLFNFICEEFDSPVVRLNSNSIEEYNQKIDKLVMNSMVSLDFNINPNCSSVNGGTDEDEESET